MWKKTWLKAQIHNRKAASVTYMSGVLFLHLIAALDFERNTGTWHLPVIKSYIGSRVLEGWHHISHVVQWCVGSSGESVAPGSSWLTS